MEVFVKRSMLTLFLCLHVSISLAWCQAFFTPQDDLTSLCVAMIDAEQLSIHGAMYMFTDKKVAQALINSKKRGVHVEMILDQISMITYGKGVVLQQAGIAVFVHRTQVYNPYSMALMHHKFFVFGKNKDNKSLLWTGSWNSTLRATQHNDENVIVLDDQQVVTSYLENFLKLKERLLADDTW